MIAFDLGRRRKADDGGYAYGSWPYGWRAVGHELIEDAGEQAALRRMCELRHVGRSYLQIAATLR